MMSGKSSVSELQEMAQVQIIPLPLYDIQSKGSEFRAILKLEKNGEIFSEAFGKTKQSAKELCAKKALKILKQNVPSDFCGSLNGLFENHVGKLKEICDKKMIPNPIYIECGTEYGEFIIKCQLFDNTVTRGKGRTKNDAKHKAAEAMIKVYSDKRELRYPNPIKVRKVEYQKTTDTTFNNHVEKIYESSSKTFKTFPSCAKNENLSTKCEILLSPIKLSDNPVGSLYEMCVKKMVPTPTYIERGAQYGEFIIECHLFDNTVTRGQGRTKKEAKRKAAEAMIKVCNDREKSRNQKPIVVTKVEYQKTTNLTFENPAQNVNESSSERFETFLACAKNANLIDEVNENISRKFYELLVSPSKLSEDNYVGRLNEICAKKMVAAPTYTQCKEANGEFVIECRIFDNTFTRGQSKNKKDAKTNAAKAMLKLYNERSVEIKSSPTTYLENHVGRLNEICSQRHKSKPSYTEFVSQNGEFIVECKVSDNTTQGQSRNKKDAKQKAAEAMLDKMGEKKSQKITFLRQDLFDQNIELFPNELSSFSAALCENNVNILNEICSQKSLSLPTYIERLAENGEFVTECKIMQDTQGRSSVSRENASQEAAEAMIQTLTQSLELGSQHPFKFVTIVGTRNEGLQKPLDELIPHNLVKQSDISLLPDMNEEQLKFELRNLNVTYKISTLIKFKNMFMLKTKSTNSCKSLVFIAIGRDTIKVHLDLLRKALFGMRIMKTDLN